VAQLDNVSVKAVLYKNGAAGGNMVQDKELQPWRHIAASGCGHMRKYGATLTFVQRVVGVFVVVEDIGWG